MIILGIDPGTATTGYGVIKKKIKRKGLIKGGQKSKTRNKLEHIAHGTIKTDPTLSDAQRLKLLYNQLTVIIGKYKPKIIAVEKLYFFKNLKTVIPVSQAKGVILLAAEKKKMKIFEFTPLQVKMITTGYGRADKKEVQRMMKTLLCLEKIPKPDDAADALAVAVSCAKTLDKTF